jgi:hypothetical protein
MGLFMECRAAGEWAAACRVWDRLRGEGGRWAVRRAMAAIGRQALRCSG